MYFQTTKYYFLSVLLQGVKINSRLKLAFVWMPKMGSTFWKRAWGPLNQAPTKATLPKAKAGQLGTNSVTKLFQNITDKVSV